MKTTQIREIPENQDSTGKWVANVVFHPKPETVPGSTSTFWSKRSVKHNTTNTALEQMSVCHEYGGL